MSVLDVQALFTMQRELDRKIMESHNLGETQEIIKAKVLALYVELGELANETRCFKYWSVKPPSAKVKMLEEYVDAIHFVLSLGLSLQYERDFRIDEEQQTQANQPKEIQQQIAAFGNVFSLVATFAEETSFANYDQLFQGIIHLGKVLGFTWAEIAAAYLAKNEVNHKRQEEGY